jgi:hypothetical protein
VVRVPEHEVLAVGAELCGRQAQAPHRRVHVAARRVRRLEPCTPEVWTAVSRLVVTDAAAVIKQARECHGVASVLLNYRVSGGGR